MMTKDASHLSNDSSGLFQWLAEEAATDPHREVLIEYVGDTRRTATLGGLFAASCSVAAGLGELGIREGDTVGIWLPNQIEWMVSQFACAAMGAVVLGLNTRYKSHEMTHLLGTVKVSLIIVPGDFLGIDFVGTLRVAVDSLLETDEAFAAPRLVFVGEVPPAASAPSYGAMRFVDVAATAPLTQWQPRPGNLSNLFTTSGSTSAPKVAGHDQTSIVRHARAGARALGVKEGDRILAALPICGVFGFNSAMALLVGGGSAVLMRSFDARRAAELLHTEKITHVVSGDEMLGAMFDEVPSGTDLPALRRGGIANFAGRAKEIVATADELWGAKISGVYGSSELFALSAIWPEDTEVGLRALGGGVLVDEGIELRVMDIDDALPTPDGAPGELQFRGYNTITGYLNNEDATNAAITDDGWFRTGDLGYVSGPAFVYLCRAREVLRLRGFLVEPSEIESFFSGFDIVEEVHVVGVDTDRGTQAIAFVRTRAGTIFDEQTLLGEARLSLANFKVPTRIVEVTQFPTTTGTNGTKVRFEALRDIGRDLLSRTS